jgi:sugar lactone lactonase YvrE
MGRQLPAQPQVILSGLAFPESPRWHDGRLWVSDWGAGQVIALSIDGRTEGGPGDVVASVQSFPMCIDHLPDGRLLIVASSQQRILRQEHDGSLVTHADLSGVSAHPWNDIVVDGRGNAYVNNIGFDFPEGEVAPGTVTLVTPDGNLRQVADSVMFPNGMVVTPDGATLIVAESYGNRLTAFDIAGDGTLGGQRTWADVEDHPDGICLDAEGAIWYGDVGSQRAVRVREGGEVLDVIELDRGCFATMLGGPDRQTLFLVTNAWGDLASQSDGTGQGQVLAVPAPAPGAGRP